MALAECLHRRWPVGAQVDAAGGAGPVRRGARPRVRRLRAAERPRSPGCRSSAASAATSWSIEGLLKLAVSGMRDARARRTLAIPVKPVATLDAQAPEMDRSLDHRDGPRDECGVFGIYAPDTTSPGSRTSPSSRSSIADRSRRASPPPPRGGNIIAIRDQGLVSQVFDENTLRSLRRRHGDRPRPLLDDRLLGVGERPADRARRPPHAGAGPQRQPDQRRRAARRAARAPTSRSAPPRTRRSSPRCWPPIPAERIEDAVADVLPRLRGAFSTVVLTEEAVVAFRDPAGLRPLAIGRIEDPDGGSRRLLRGQRVVRV